MKNLTFFLLSVFILLLAACDNNEEPSTEEATATEDEDSSEMTELEEENEELRRQLEEQDDKDVNGEATEETEAGSDDNGTGSSDTAEGTESEDNQNDNTEGNRSDLVFDINSSEVQAYINKNDNYDDEGNFVQDAISVGMTQSEIETLYGMHDYIVPATTTEAAAIYENIAVVYEERGPYVADTDSNIDPDNNRADWVLYFANLPVDEVLNTMGSPDEQLTNLMGTQNYIYKGNSSNDEWGTIMLSEHDTPEGLRIGSLSVSDSVENSDETDQSTVNEEDIRMTDKPNPNAELHDEDRYEYLLKEYLQRLTFHYNMVEYEDVYYYLRRGSAAYDKIAANKASGNFTGHKTENVELVEMTDLGDGTVKLNANRVYSHDNSNGRRIANVNYIVNAETHEVLDFEQISDAAY